MDTFNRAFGCAAVLAVFMVVFPGAAAFAQTVELHKRGSRIKVSVAVVTSFREVDVKIQNQSSSSRTLSINGSHWFKSLDGNTKYQDLAVVFPIRVTVGANATKVVRVRTACKQADRTPPTTGLVMKPGKTKTTDRKFGGLIAGYHSPLLHQIIATSTGSQHHATDKKKQEFLQLMTWIYFQSKRDHMEKFATKHMFKGNKAKAKQFVARLYPLAQKAINLYKAAPIPVPILP